MLGEAQQKVLGRVLERKLHGDSDLRAGSKALAAAFLKVALLMLASALLVFALPSIFSTTGLSGGGFPVLIFEILVFVSHLIFFYLIARLLLPLSMDLIGICGFFNQRLRYVRATDMREIVELRFNDLRRDFAWLRGWPNA